MADKDHIPYGSDVSGGAFACVDCGEGIQMESGDSLPPCPYIDDKPHPQKGWKNLYGGGDAADDPQG